MYLSDAIDPLLLKRFVNFELLSEVELRAIAKTLRLQFADAGDVLFHSGGVERDEFFLVTGELKLIADDGRAHLIPATSGLARQPIARLRPRRYTAVAKTPVAYFVFDVSAIAATPAKLKARADYNGGIEVAEISFETYQIAEELYHQRRGNRAVG